MSDALHELLDGEYIPEGSWSNPHNIRQRLARVFARLEDYLGEAPTLNDLNERVIALWVRDLLVGGLSPATVHDYVSRIRAFWTWCHKQGLVDRPPRLGSIRDFSRRPRAWTAKEVEKIVSACREVSGELEGVPAGPWWEALHFLAWDTGEPRATLLRMRWDWFDADARTLVVPAEFRWSGLFEVAHYLEGETIERLRAIRKPARDLILPYPHSKPTFYREHGLLMAKAGIRVNRKETALRRLDEAFASRRAFSQKRPAGPSSPEQCGTFVDFAEWYVSCRSISRIYANQLRTRANKLQAFTGRKTIAEVLTEQNVNAFLASIEHHKPATIRGYRVDLLTLWGAAADENLVKYPRRRRIRRARVPQQVIDCYTVAEAEAILEAAVRLEGAYPSGVMRRDYWNAAVRLAWDSGLRRGDIWAFRLQNVDPAGNWRCVQHKTGKLAAGRIHPSTRAALAAIGTDQPCEWPLPVEQFSREFRRLRDLAGVTRGTWKWFRRSSGSYVEAQQAGAGHRHLGHATESIFTTHYDARLAERSVVQPPELATDRTA